MTRLKLLTIKYKPEVATKNQFAFFFNSNKIKKKFLENPPNEFDESEYGNIRDGINEGIYDRISKKYILFVHGNSDIEIAPGIIYEHFEDISGYYLLDIVTAREQKEYGTNGLVYWNIDIMKKL